MLRRALWAGLAMLAITPALAAVTIDLSAGPQTINLMNGAVPIGQIIINGPAVPALSNPLPVVF